MTAQSWFKFYPSDWYGDAKLQACSLAARGLWIDLICIMTEATPYGHLVFNGKPMSCYRIAKLIHADKKQVQRLVAQLKRGGVFGVTSRGILYSRRMVRDKEKSEAAKEFAQKRWGVRPHAPDTRKKERGPTKRKKSRAAWEIDLLRDLGQRDYANAIAMLANDPALCERATQAEMRKPGDGIQVIVMGLQRHIREAVP